MEELRRALVAARAETAALRAASEGADRAPRGNESGDAGEADSAYRPTYDGGYAGTRADGHAGPNARQGANTANFFWSGKIRPVPKFPKNEDEAAMWHLRFRAHLDGMGLGYTLDHAATPVPVKGDQRDLILRYGEQPVQHAQAAWACLLDATAGAAFEERVLSAVTVRDAWCQILSWTGPSSEAETFFLERQLETVPNYGDENPKLFFSRVDQLLTRLRSADIHKTERQIVNILVRNLSDHYEIEKRSRLDSPLLRRQDVEHIVRASWPTRKTRQLEQRSTSGVTPNPHALAARGGYGGPRRGGGRSSGSGRGLQQSWSRGGGNHHIHRQQQQQHPRSPSKPLTANFGLGGPFDGGTNAGGWPQEESPPSPDGSGPHCERCGRKGHVARICRAPSRFEGICDTCGQYGHRMRYCIRNQPAPHAHVVATPVGYHRAMQQAGNGGDGVAFAAEDGGHEDEGYFGGPFSSVFGGPELGHGPTAYVLQLPTSGRSSGTGCDIPRSPPRYSGSNNGYGTKRGPQQQYGSGSRSYRATPFVRHYRGGDGTALWPQQQHGPRPFCSFGWDKRGACRDGPPVNGLAHSITQGRAQRGVEMGCHGGPVSKVSGPPERGGPPLQARHQRGLQPPSETLSPPAAVISDSASEECLQSNEMKMPMFSLSKGQRQQSPNSAASVRGAPASSAVAAAPAETSAAEPAASGPVPSAAPIRGLVGARESSDGAVSSDAAAEAAPSTGDTAAPAAPAARAARALASTAGSADDSWAWPISQGRLRFYPRKRVSARQLPPRPRPIPRSSATCARLAHSRSWGGHSNEGSTLSRPGGCILGRVKSLAL